MRFSFIVALFAAVGCHGGTREAAGDPRAAFAGIHGARFVWLEADCNDGPLDLASLGFERALNVALDRGTLELTFDTTFATRGCTASAVWLAKPSTRSSAWRFEPQANVVLPAGADCGAVETEAVEGTLRSFDDTLELVTQNSPWCRGFDARFVFQRVAPAQPSPSQVVMHYVAAFNRRDASAVAALFDDNGSLIEPFTRTDDGNFKRHEGRSAVRAWYARALASAPWVALRLLAIEPGSAADAADTGQLIAQWEYMDANLAEPLRGRNLFVVAGGEIYETELQLLTDPKPKPPGTEAAITASAAQVGEAP
jgi:hypothetical protein